MTPKYRRCPSFADAVSQTRHMDKKDTEDIVHLRQCDPKKHFDSNQRDLKKQNKTTTFRNLEEKSKIKKKKE